MAPVTPPAHHPTRPPVVSQQEAGQDRRARWWTGGGRGHCGRQCAILVLPRCKREIQDAQHKQAAGGGGGGRGEGGKGDKPRQTADRPKPPPNKIPNKIINTYALQTKNPNTPFGLRERTKRPTKRNTGEPRGVGAKPRRVHQDDGEEATRPR